MKIPKSLRKKAMLRYIEGKERKEKVYMWLFDREDVKKAFENIKK